MTRYDIAYAVNVLQQHASDPKREHLLQAKHLLRYLKYTRDTGILFTSNKDGLLQWRQRN